MKIRLIETAMSYISTPIQAATKTLETKQKQLDEVVARQQGIERRREKTLLDEREAKHKSTSVQLERAQHIVVALQLQQAGANDLLVRAKTLCDVRAALEAGADVGKVNVKELYLALKEEGNDRFDFIKLLIQYGADPGKLNVDPQSNKIQSLLNTGRLCRVLEVKNKEPWTSVEDMYKACTESLKARLETEKGFDVTQPVIGKLSMLRLVEQLLPADSATKAAAGAAGAAAEVPLSDELSQLLNVLQTATNRALAKAVEELNVEKVTAALDAGAQWLETAASAEGGGGAAAQPINHLRKAIERRDALAEEGKQLALDIAKKQAAIAKADEEIKAKIGKARGDVQLAQTKLREAQKTLSDALAAASAKTGTLRGWLNGLLMRWEKRNIKMSHSKTIQAATKTLEAMKKRWTDVLLVEIGGIRKRRNTTAKILKENKAKHAEKVDQHTKAQQIVETLQQHKVGANAVLLGAETLVGVQTALEAGADVNAVDQKGNGSLYRALIVGMPQEGTPAFTERVNLIKLLIQYGADPGDLRVDFISVLPKEILVLIYTGILWHALKEGNVELAREMLNRDADVSLTHIDAEENTALKYAIHAKKNQKELVELLIKYGANPLQQTDKGKRRVEQQNEDRIRKRQTPLPVDKSLRLIFLQNNQRRQVRKTKRPKIYGAIFLVCCMWVVSFVC